MTKEAQPVPAVVPAIAPTKHAKPPARPRAAKRAHVLEATTMVKLLLRRIAEHVHDPDGATGKLQQARVAFAATEVAGLWREIARVAVLDKVDWNAAAAELAQGLHAATAIQAMLTGTGLGAVRTELQHALAGAAERVPAKAWATAHAGPAPTAARPLDRDDHFELARNAVIAACREVTVFKHLTPTGDDKAEGLALMAPIPQHFQVAIEAAARVPKHQRMALVPDMELASKGMDYADGFLSSPPKARWNRVYAAAFDAENRARETIGAKPLRVRTYSGMVDPERAIEAVTQMARDGKATEGWASKAFDTPQQAVVGITASLDRIFEAKYDAVGRFAVDIKEPPRPPSTPLWQKLLEIAVKTALASAASGLAAYAETAIKLRVDRLAGRMAGIPQDYYKMLPKELQERWIADKTSSIGRKVAADATKDGFKEIIKSSGHLAFTLLMPKPLAKTNAREPVSGFVQVQQEILREAKHQARMMMAHLGPALGQADLDVLNALHLALYHDIASAAGDGQYHATITEWQNHKARLHAGESKANDPAASVSAKSKRTNAPKPTGKGDVLDAAVDGETLGALDAKIYVQTDPASRGNFYGATLKLPGAEPATIRHLRAQNQQLAALPMHKRFDLRFVSYMVEDRLEVGVGPNQGLLLSSLDAREKALMKVYTTKDRMSSSDIWAARTTREYDHVPDREAIDALSKLLERISQSLRLRDLQGRGE